MVSTGFISSSLDLVSINTGGHSDVKVLFQSTVPSLVSSHPPCWFAPFAWLLSLFKLADAEPSQSDRAACEAKKVDCG